MIDKMLKDILKNKFLVYRLKPFQKRVIDLLLKGSNVFSRLKTGYGKSLFYQLASFIIKGKILVFSPLISLMVEQEIKLQKLGIDYLIINSISKKMMDLSKIEEEIINAKTRIIFVTPEQLKCCEIVEILKKINIGLYVIDEAHCISFWGYDFRPSYLSVVKFFNEINEKKKIQLLLLTATANSMLINEISRMFNTKIEIIKASVFKPNIILKKVLCKNELNKLSKIITILNNVPGKCIIYCKTHYDCEKVNYLLNKVGISSNSYHAGLSKNDRLLIQNDFMENKIRVLCSTNAFGMGIDIKDIRTIIHIYVPSSIEMYYQEIGRAGRDKKISNCILLYAKQEVKLIKENIKKSEINIKVIIKILKIIPFPEGISMNYIIIKTGIEKVILDKNLEFLIKSRVLIRDNNFIYRREEDDNLEKIINNHEIKMALSKTYLKAILEYLKTKKCLWNYICKYFEEKKELNCKLNKYCHKDIEYTQVIDIKTIENILDKHVFKIKPTKYHSGGYSMGFFNENMAQNEIYKSKYISHSSISDEIINKSINFIQNNYNINEIQIITNIPETRNKEFITDFGRKIAEKLKKIYIQFCSGFPNKTETKKIKNTILKKMHLKNIYKINFPKIDFSNAKILVIDDIYDSGTTINEYTKVLKDFKFKEIMIFTLCCTRRNW